MECKNLMIGDWVCEGNDHPIQVIRNYGRSIMYKKEDNSNEVEETCLNPLPLTEEILKANGFKLIVDKENNYCGGIIKNDDITVWVHLGDRYNYHTRIVNHKLLVTEKIRLDLSIRYVHELQHALRLCGLTDLANNFKIK